MQWDNDREGEMRTNLAHLYLLRYFQSPWFYERSQIYCETFLWKTGPWAKLQLSSIHSQICLEPASTYLSWLRSRNPCKWHHSDIFSTLSLCCLIAKMSPVFLRSPVLISCLSKQTSLRSFLWWKAFISLLIGLFHQCLLLFNSVRMSSAQSLKIRHVLFCIDTKKQQKGCLCNLSVY